MVLLPTRPLHRVAPRAKGRLAGYRRQREVRSDFDLGESDFFGSGAGYGEGYGDYDRDNPCW